MSFFSDPNRPQRPQWESLQGPRGGLRPQYQLRQNKFQNRMSNQAMRTPGTQSPWRMLMEENLNRNAAQASQNAQSQSLNQMSNLAMLGGGLTGGASERLAHRGAENAIMAQQNVLGQGLQYDLQDEENRIKDLRFLSQAADNRNRFNIQNLLGEIGARRTDERTAYDEMMRAWAAERTAQQTPNMQRPKGLVDRLFGWL